MLRGWFLLCSMLALVLVSACGDATLDEVDPGAAPASPTYFDDVAPIMAARCVPCHADGAQPGDNIAGYGYDTCDKVKSGWGGLVSTGFVDKTMPPGGAERITSSEELTLQRWHDQGSSCADTVPP